MMRSVYMKVSELIEALSKMNSNDVVMIPTVGSASLFSALSRDNIKESDGKVWINPDIRESFDDSSSDDGVVEDEIDTMIYDKGFADKIF